MQTVDCRPGGKCRLRVNKKKTRRSSRGQMKTWVRTRARNFFPKFSNSHQNAFPSLSQTFHYQPRVLELPILFPQGLERIVILCLFNTCVYVSVILNCVYSIRSGTDQLSISFILFIHRQILRITLKAPRVLVVLKGFAIVRNTRQAKHGSTTTGQAKHVGIKPSL